MILWQTFLPTHPSLKSEFCKTTPFGLLLHPYRSSIIHIMIIIIKSYAMKINRTIMNLLCIIPIYFELEENILIHNNG